jgi:ABC-type multidrug transport system fused ATPase/permease subunit
LEAPDDPDSKLPIVQFSIAIYYAEKTEGKMKLDICKLGDPFACCSVKYKCFDSPYAGVKFEPIEGTIEFKEKEPTKSIYVPIIDTKDAFDSSREFTLALSDPVGCTLGLYLKNCRVKIVERSVFPTPRFNMKLRDEEIDAHWKSETSFSLLVECFKFLKGHCPNAYKLVVFNFVENTYTMLSVFVMQILVDYLDNPKSQGDPDAFQYLLRYSLLLIIPNPILHIFDFKKSYWGIMTLPRRVLQENLICKFLNYEENLRADFSSQLFIHCVLQDVPELVLQGFRNFFVLADCASMMLLLVVYSVGTAFLGVGVQYALAVGTIIGMNGLIYPTVMLLFISKRKKIARAMQDVQEQREIALINEVGDMVAHYRSIADFFRRPKVAKQIEDRVIDFNAAVADVLAVRTNNEYCPKWISLTIMSIYIIGGGALVGQGYLGVGTYLALLRVTTITGESFTKAFKAYLMMYDAFLPLWRIRRFMNTSTDLPKREAANRIRRQKGEELRTEQRSKMTKEQLQSGIPVVDFLQISLEDVGFQFAGSDAPLLKNISVTFQQGNLIGIMGPPSSGKGTFLELLGGVLELEQGTMFIPPHLRVLHVSRQAYVIAGTVADNLFFGVTGVPGQAQRPEELDQAQRDRGFRICQRLRFPKRLMDMATNYQGRGMDLGLALSRTDKKLIHLARAFIYNPEVIVIHTPGMYFDKENKARVIQLLKEFVRQRGVEMDPATRLRRRPRTCIFSTYDISDMTFVDQMLTLNKHGKLMKQQNGFMNAFPNALQEQLAEMQKKL